MRLGLLWALVASAALAADGGDLGRAIDLPAKAQALRDEGVPPAEVAAAVRASKDHGLSAGATTDVLEAAEGEHLDNLGAFVQQKLDEGLRGRALADAIHAEQGRGGGVGRGRGEGRGPDGEHGPDADHGQSGEHGPDGAPGQSGEHGGGEGGKEGKEGKSKSGKGGH